jgi:hypothetical protein
MTIPERKPDKTPLPFYRPALRKKRYTEIKSLFIRGETP